MSTAQALARKGARHIRRACWKEGRVYLDQNGVAPGDRDTWCFVHPHDTPDPRPQVLFLYMLPGDDWEEVPDASDQQSPVQLHGGDSPRDEAEER